MNTQGVLAKPGLRLVLPRRARWAVPRQGLKLNSYDVMVSAFPQSPPWVNRSLAIHPQGITLLNILSCRREVVTAILICEAKQTRQL